MRRWLGRLLLLALTLVLLASAAVAVVWWRLPEDELAVVEPGRLAVAAEARDHYEVGGLTVHVTARDVQVARGDVVLWASRPGTSFVTAAQGTVDWTEHRGYFWPRVRHVASYDELSLEAASVADGVLELTGRVLDGDRTLPVTVRIRDDAPRARIGVAVPLADAVALVSGRGSGAGVHGLGEQFDAFDLSGRLIPVVVREQGVGRGAQPLTFLADVTNKGAGGTRDTTYAAWSRFVTDDLRGLALDPARPESHAFAVADTRDPARVGLEVWADRVEAVVAGGRTPAELVQAMAADSRPALADWPLGGAVLGVQGGTDAVRRAVADLREAGADLSAVWIQDWSGRRRTDFGDRLWWTWQLDRERYPGWSELVRDLRREGVRMTTYVNPFLVDAAPKGDDEIRNLMTEAADRGYLVEDRDGEVRMLDQGGFSAALVDLTDVEAREWFARVIAQYVLADGVEGFMADFGEGLPFDAVLEEGEAAYAHDRWPLLWARTVRRACELAEQPDCVTWFRSGSVGMDAQAALFWNGDQTVTFDEHDGLASALRGTFNAGVSGWPLVHSDVGGYTSIDAVVEDYVRSRELLARWTEYEAFGVVMRTHEGNRPDQNLQAYSDPRTREEFATMTRVHAALEPYRRQVVDEATRTGLPAIRHGWLARPGTDAAEVDTQFFLGDDVLVAPVLTEGADEVEVTLPPGRWQHLLTGEVLEGARTVTVDAPVGTPAAYVATDSPWARRLVPAVRRALAG